MNQPPLFAIFRQWIECGWLTQLDYAFAGFLYHQDQTASDAVLWAGVLVSHQLGRGEVYLDLEKLCLQPGLTLSIPNDEVWQTTNASVETADTELSILRAYSLAAWQSALTKSSLVSTGSGNTPLVLQDNRLYLRRYWQYQQTLLSEIQERLRSIANPLPQAIEQTLQVLFADNHEQPDWQKIACVLALRARFAIITGGPGTGKTTTLTKLLSLLIQMAETQPAQRKLNILLAAPTGKAAARVSESIAKALQHLEAPDSIKQQIPQSASTLHRLLGSRPDSRRYQHHKNNPLLADIVIVDEASMIDLEMMAALLEALPSQAQLILLGDKDQLASVEAGSVMGDLCQGAEFAAYDQATREWISRYANEILPASSQAGSNTHQQTVMLRYSHRFGEHSGIGQLAKAVNSSDVNRAQNIFSRARHPGSSCFDDSVSYPDLERLLLSDVNDNRLKQLMLATNIAKSKHGYGYYLQVMHQRPGNTAEYEDWAIETLRAFDSFQVLCALRLGDWGVEGLNQRIEQWLFPGKKSGIWYAGRPVMITRNDYNLGLMNGDIGIALPDIADKLRVVFPRNESSGHANLRWISPMRLPDVETAFAMTVHKSQGSEFRHVALILPEVRSPVLTKELVYTGITRAREHFSLLESRTGVFEQAIQVSR